MQNRFSANKETKQQKQSDEVLQRKHLIALYKHILTAVEIAVHQFKHLLLVAIDVGT